VGGYVPLEKAGWATVWCAFAADQLPPGCCFFRKNASSRTLVIVGYALSTDEFTTASALCSGDSSAWLSARQRGNIYLNYKIMRLITS
jgi:hypothetical protein